MTHAWTRNYYDTLLERFAEILVGLDTRLDDIVAGRVAPALDDITIGSGRRVRAGVIFFDIVGFSTRTGHADMDALKRTLYMLDCVIPMVMHVVFDHGAYVEKNTGDGVMAIVGVGEDDGAIANTALDIAIAGLYVTEKLINPWLVREGIDPVELRITMDMGNLLIARIGTAKGSAKHDRSFLTAVGPAANLASKLQRHAGANEIWTGNLIRTNARENRHEHFHDVTPAIGWTWTWVGGPRTGQIYRIYRYGGRRLDP